jgi:hypothetical protein
LAGLNKKIRTKPREKWKLVTGATAVYHNLKSIELDLTDKAIAQKIANTSATVFIMLAKH